MTPYRQPIRPGQVGSDVRAVKRAMVRASVIGAGTMVIDSRAGNAFVQVLRTFQRNHGLPSTGTYGRGAHELIAPHFDAYGVQLYRNARIRNPPMPPPPGGDAATNAKQLLQFHSSGKYVARNPGDLHDVQATADGKAVWSQGGYWVHVDARVMKALVWLIEQGHKIGTYAICSDHHWDGPHGHGGGLAVDIEWIDGVPVGVHSAACKTNVLAVNHALRSAESGALHPRQLISGGYGNVRDGECSACSIPAADAFYGSGTMQQHTNHIHVGY